MPILTGFVRIVAILACNAVVACHAATTCTGPSDTRDATSASIAEFVGGLRKRVLTFAGYSGAGYQRPEAMLKQAGRALDRRSPSDTVVNVGATAEGIGRVYELAKRRGFTNIGIVSTRARDERVALSPCVDHVFFVQDATWGGRQPGSTELSSTSAAIVANSAAFVVIGGGDIARDEALAAREAGKPVTFMPADMSHAIARDKARKRGLPAPGDFRGSAHAALDAGH